EVRPSPAPSYTFTCGTACPAPTTNGPANAAEDDAAATAANTQHTPGLVMTISPHPGRVTAPRTASRLPPSPGNQNALRRGASQERIGPHPRYGASPSIGP